MPYSISRAERVTGVADTAGDAQVDAEVLKGMKDTALLQAKAMPHSIARPPDVTSFNAAIEG